MWASSSFWGLPDPGSLVILPFSLMFAFSLLTVLRLILTWASSPICFEEHPIEWSVLILEYHFALSSWLIWILWAEDRRTCSSDSSSSSSLLSSIKWSFDSSSELESKFWGIMWEIRLERAFYFALRFMRCIW